MRQQRGFIVVFIGLFSLLLVASVIGFLLVKVTSKAQAKTTAATFSLAGDVKNYCPPPCKPPGPSGLPGVTITFTRVTGAGAVPTPVQTGEDGKFSQTGFEEGTTYRVTPSGLYRPAFLDFSSGNNQIFFSVSYPTISASGRITFNGQGLEGVRVDVVGATGPTQPPVQELTFSDANGYWNIQEIRSFTILYSVYAAKPGYLIMPCSQMFFFSPQGQLNFEASLPTFIPVSSADFKPRAGYCSYPSIAHESIASIFGSNLATTTQIATSQPLPTELAGTRIMIKYDDGVERDASLFFVSPSQINFHVPTVASFYFSSATGYFRTSSIQVVRDGVVVNQGNVSITNFQPTIFTADASGKGLPAAVAYRLKANGLDSYEPISRFDSVQGRLVPVPIQFGDETEQLFLVLFGTGGKAPLDRYEVTIGGTPAQVTYVGLQPSFVGVIQTNILLPRTLIGRGDAEVKLSALGREANPVTVNIQ